MRLSQRSNVLALLAAAIPLALVSLSAQRPARHDASDVTFHKDVLPILQKNCQSCHRPGQIGPMGLLSYDETRPWARAIKERVVKREMPPWFADSHYGQFSNDRSMQQADIDAIVQWVDKGALPGDPKDAPPPVAWPADGWMIKPDHIVRGGEYRVPKSGVLEWMYITMPTGFARDTWVTSMELRPGQNARLTHHYCVFVVPHQEGIKYGVPSETRGAFNQDRATMNAPFEGCYEPGQQPFDYREFSAARMIPANSDIVFQMHYNPLGEEALDQPQIGFTLAKERPRQQFTFVNVGAGLKLDIPPGAPDYQAPTQEAVLNVDAQIVWLQGHAHYRAKELTFTINHIDGRSEVPLKLHWHPYWQLLYYPMKVIVAPKGTRLQVDGRYDNSSANRFNPDPNAPVRFGDTTKDEMMFPTFGLIVDGSVDVRRTNAVIAPSARADATFTVVGSPKTISN
jgi:hypothetical protein